MPREQLPKFEGPESRELKPEERINLVEAWLDVAIDGEEMPDGVSNWTNERLRTWLFGTLMADTDRLAKNWGLEPDRSLIDQIKGEKNIEVRAKLERDYIESIREVMNTFLKKHPKLPDEGYKWDSWPKKMREEKSFNCVGGTLLGMLLLERAGIVSYYGILESHVLNIVKLANGEWVYADFTNSHIKKNKTRRGGFGRSQSNEVVRERYNLPLCGASRKFRCAGLHSGKFRFPFARSYG